MPVIPASERSLYQGRRSRLLLTSRPAAGPPMDLPDRDLTRPLEAVGRQSFIGFAQFVRSKRRQRLHAGQHTRRLFRLSCRP